MAKRGPPCKVDEVLIEGPWKGKTRGQAACEMRAHGARHRHCAGAAEVGRETLFGWLRENDEFRTAYARAESDGVKALLIEAHDSREAADLLGRCHGYHHSVSDEEPDAKAQPADAAAVFALLQRLWAEAPHLVEAARAENREPEAVVNK